MPVKASVIQEPGRITIEEFPLPEIDEHSLLVRVDEVGVCGSDRHMYLGHSNLKWPVLPGHEIAGTIVEQGDAVDERMKIIGGPIQVGDRITVVPSSQQCGKCWYCIHVPHMTALCSNRTVYGFRTCAEAPHLWGGYSDLMFVHSHSWVFKLPDDLDPLRAPLIEPVAVATRAVDRALEMSIPHIGEGFGVGKRVAVVGAGPIGVLVVAVLRTLGAGLIIVTDAMESRLEMARQMGADVTINIGERDRQERLQHILEMTDQIGVDIAIECAGVPDAFSECIDVTRRGGRVIEVGHYTDPGETSLRPHQVCNKELNVLGCWAYPPMQFKTAIDFLRRTPVAVEEIITHRMSITELERAIEMMAEPDVMKVVLGAVPQ